MSVELCVFLRDERLPSRDQWQRAIKDRAIDLEFDDFSTRDQSGFLPMRLNGKECGFEYYFNYVEEEPEEVLAEIGDRDRSVSFVLHLGPKDDLDAAICAAAILTMISDGVFLDPQTGEFARGEGVFELIRQQDEAARERGRQQAAKDAAITNRRCPRCNSPCPEYRKTCKACGFEIGRQV